MRKLFNRYFDFIGVENEGHKRILIIIIIFWFLYILIQVIDEILSVFGIRGDINEIIFGLGISLIITFFSVGFVIKTFNWVKDGFNKEKNSR
jgi:hypothetical protein